VFKFSANPLILARIARFVCIIAKQLRIAPQTTKKPQPFLPVAWNEELRPH